MFEFTGIKNNNNIQAYKTFLQLLQDNGHTLASDYFNRNSEVLINFNCGHELQSMSSHDYKNNNKRCAICNKKGLVYSEYVFKQLLQQNNHQLCSDFINNSAQTLIKYDNNKKEWIAPTQYKKQFTIQDK